MSEKLFINVAMERTMSTIQKIIVEMFSEALSFVMLNKLVK